MVLLLLFFLFPSLAESSPQEILKSVIIEANESEQSLDQKTIVLKGGVKVSFKNQILNAEYARIDLTKNSLFASGGVQIVSPDAVMMGEEALIDIQTGAAFLNQGSLMSGNIYFEGRSLQKTENNEFIAEYGKYTTCQNCPETWSFVSSKIRAQLGGYAYMKNIVLRFGGVPVFWMPYIVVPLKSERQTGLLTPDLELSTRGGLTIGQSFFWAPSPSKDFTFTAKNYELRGLKAMVNYNYVLDKNSYGQLDFATLNDKSLSQEPRFKKFNRIEDLHKNRWFFKYEHFYELPDDTIHRVKLNNSNDLQYPKDFPLETLLHGDSAMESRTSITHNTSQFHKSIEVGYYINLLDSDPFAENRNSVHRFPEIRLSQTHSSFFNSEWKYNLDLSYTYFARNYFTYDDMNASYQNQVVNQKRFVPATGSIAECSTFDWYQHPECQPQTDGQFDVNKDLIRGGQRLDLHTQIFKTYKISEILLTPSLGFKNQSYEFDIPEITGAYRQFLKTELRASTQFYHISENGYKHEIMPELSFVSIPWISESPHPFFGDSARTPYSANTNISNNDLNSPWGLQFDYYDRVFDRKLLNFGLVNKWVEKIAASDIPNQYVTRAIWRLGQSYDFYQEEIMTENPQPLSDLNSELTLYFNKFELYQKASYFPYYSVTNLSSRIRFPLEQDSFIELSHLRSYNNLTPGQSIDVNQRTEDVTLYIKKNFLNFAVLGRGTWDTNLSNLSGGKLKSIGFSAQIKLPGDCWYLTIAQYQVTGGDSVFKFNFDFIWDPQKRPSLPEEFLNQIGF